MRQLIGLILSLVLMSSAWAGEFAIQSSAYQDGAKIPVKYTCDGGNVSPPLTWANPPANTKSFVLVYSAPLWINAEIYLWVVYNIPRNVKGLEQDLETLPQGSQSLYNYYDSKGYRGPCPPNARPHDYIFTLYALDTVLTPLADDTDPEKLLRAIKPHVLAKTQLKGVYTH